MAGTGVGKFSSTASNNTSNLTVNFAENMAPSNVNNAARELMGHMRDMYEQLGDGYFEFGDGDGEYTVTRGDADTITITGTGDITSVYYVGRKIRITDGGANVVEGVISGSSHSSTTQTIDLTGISLASGTPTKVELGIDTAAFGGKVIFDDDGDTYIEAPTDDTLDIYIAGAKDFVFTANTFTAESGSTIAAQALTATTGAFTDNVTITTADNTDTLTLTSTDADAAVGPNLNLYRNSSSPANNDLIGNIAYNFTNNNSQSVAGFSINAMARNVVDGSENVKAIFETFSSGTSRNRFMIDTGETVFNEDSVDVDFRVESNGNANMIFVDGGSDHVNIGTATDLGSTLNVAGTVHIETSGNETTLQLKSTDADASAGPRISMNRDSSSPADGDDLGKIFFFGKNDADEDQGYAEIMAEISDASDGTEDGRLVFNMRQAGATVEAIRVEGSNGVVVNEGSADVDFRVESDGDANMLFVDGGNNAVGIATNSPVLADGRGLVVHGAASVARVELRNDTSGGAATDGMFLTYSGTDAFVGNREAGTIQFWNNAAERMRIESDGGVVIGDTSTSRMLGVKAPSGFSQFTVDFNNASSSAPYGILNRYSGAAPDSGSDFSFLECTDTGANRLNIFSDGDVKNHDNSYGALSDERIKQDIVDANSQWDDIKAVKVRNFKKKDDVRQYGDNAWEQIGVVAQELEAVSPKLIRKHNPTSHDILSNSEFGTLYEDGDSIPEGKEIGDVKEIKEQVKSVSYSVLYMKAIKALQEAMTRIETLETKVAALEG